jgi:methionyl aminopeptidase
MTAIEVLNALLVDLVDKAQVGTNLMELETSAQTFLQIMGATSCNKGYAPNGRSPFPSILCLSVNEEVAHAPAKLRVLQDGDLLTIDCGLSVDNFCADAAVTIPIGSISNRDARLLRYAKEATYVGIRAIQPGVKVTEVGKAIEGYAKRNGYVVVKPLAGHGIGKTMHEDPTIPMYDIGLEEIVTVNEKGKKAYEYKEYTNTPTFQEGQIVCIEPHLTYKDEFGIVGSDGWTLSSRDEKRSAMFEHMARVTKFGAEILTKHYD